MLAALAFPSLAIAVCKRSDILDALLWRVECKLPIMWTLTTEANGTVSNHRSPKREAMSPGNVTRATNVADFVVLVAILLLRCGCDGVSRFSDSCGQIRRTRGAILSPKKIVFEISLFAHREFSVAPPGFYNKHNTPLAITCFSSMCRKDALRRSVCKVGWFHCAFRSTCLSCAQVCS